MCGGVSDEGRPRTYLQKAFIGFEARRVSIGVWPGAVFGWTEASPSQQEAN